MTAKSLPLPPWPDGAVLSVSTATPRARAGSARPLTAAAGRRLRTLPPLPSAGSPGPCLAPAHSQASGCTHLLHGHSLSPGPADQGRERSSSLRGSALCPCAHLGGYKSTDPGPKAAGSIAAITCCLGLRMNSQGGKGGTSPWGAAVAQVPKRAFAVPKSWTGPP